MPGPMGDTGLMVAPSDLEDDLIRSFTRLVSV